MSGLIETIPVLVGSGVGAASAVWLLFQYFFKSYLEAKGKNLADKEDIAKITREVESVRHDYNALLEQMKARHQLRLAALDKRLAVHQEAFTLWRELYMATASDMDKIVEKCRDWWNHHCVYLEPKVRDGFLDAINQEYMHRARMASNPHDATKMISDHMGKMFAFPNLLFEAIQLPPLAEVALKELVKNG